MTINKALPRDSRIIIKEKRGYYKKNNCPLNKKQEHVIKLVCTFGEDGEKSQVPYTPRTVQL
jgi:hypothetical protein